MALALRAKAIRTLLGPDIPVILFCPDQGAATDLNSAGLDDAVRLTPWGVHATDEPRTIVMRGYGPRWANFPELAGPDGGAAC